jgi:hypothetical protein
MGIKHPLTKPYSPATTGEGSAASRTMRAEFFRSADGQHATLAELQAALDAGWRTTTRSTGEEA